MSRTKMFGRSLIAVLAACAMFFMAGTIPVHANEATAKSTCTVGSSTFAQCLPDIGLRKAVTQALKTNDSAVITTAHVDMLTSLSARNANIVKLDGLGTFTKLTSLQLSNNDIESLVPLGTLTALTSLEMYCNKVSDVSPLAKLSNLTKIGLGDNKISDISALSALTRLKSVNFSHNTITSIDPLANSTGIEYLWMSTNRLTNVDVVNVFTNLQGADLSRNRVFSAVKITNDPPLYLVMTGQYIEYNVNVDENATFTVDMPVGYDGKPIKPISIANKGTFDEKTGKITWTANQGNGVGLVAVFESQGEGQSGDRPFSGIVQANVHINGATAVPPSSGDSKDDYKEDDPGLQTTARKTTCTDGVSTIAECFPDANLAKVIAASLGKSVNDKITQKDLDGTTRVAANGKDIKELSGIEHLKNLQRIYVSDNPVSDLSPLKDLTKLVDVRAYNANIIDVSALANKPDLWGIGLGNNHIKDVSSIVNVPKLAWVDIYANFISDFSVITSWPTLNALWVAGNPFTDVTPMANCKGLRRLQMESNGISDMSPFKNFSPSQYSMNDKQTVRREKITVNQGETVTLKTVTGRAGGYLEPTSISPEGGVYDPATGTVTWKNVKWKGNYTIGFSESDDLDYLYSGNVVQRVDVNHTDKESPKFSSIWDTRSTIGQKYDWMFAVKAIDNVDGDVTSKITIPKNTLNINKLGTYAIQYYVEDSSQNGSWAGRKVEVTNATIKSWRTYDVNTDQGVAPRLPDYAKATWSDGKETYEGVVWDAVPASKYNVGGKFKVNGKLRDGSTITTTVTVKAKELAVTSAQITGEQIVGKSLQLNTEAKATLKATAQPANATVKKVTWSVKDPSVASVNANGVVTALKVGKTAVVVDIDGKTAEVPVTVRARFTDVPTKALFSADVDWLTSMRITQGNSDGSFGYGQSLNRQDMAVFLYRFAKLRNIAGVNSYKPTESEYKKFKDVNKNSLGATEILWLAKTGITKGYADGTFGGKNLLTRQDMAIYLYRFAQAAGDTTAKNYKPTEAEYKKFKDVNKNSFGSMEILWLANTGITKGNSDGTFNGKGKLSRQDMAVFLHRTYDYLGRVVK